ncbi:MAG: L,D-transpeptidase, partial [Cyanobacteriota bacterium]|nr:L,D-transpeptidase [Cyanobacteriota bacterium]
SSATVFFVFTISVIAQENSQENTSINVINNNNSNTSTDSDVFQNVTYTSEPKIYLILKLKQRKLYVYQGEKLLNTYPVAVGKAKWETPTGNFKVMDMIKNPGWTNFKTGEKMPPGPNNPLGERWISFWTDGNDYIGFHGTPNRNSVGQAISHGCVRMYNEDVRELYELVSVGTEVIVEN